MLEPKPDMRSGEREKGGESYVMINVEKLYHSQGTMETRTRKRAMGECNWCGKAAGGKTASPGRRTPQRPEPDIGDGKRGVKSVRKLFQRWQGGGGEIMSLSRMTSQRPEPDIGDGKGDVKSVRNFPTQQDRVFPQGRAHLCW